MNTCPFCGRDPYYRVATAEGWYLPVAVICCQPMIDLHEGKKKPRQILELRRSHSTRKKARARRMMEEIYGDV